MSFDLTLILPAGTKPPDLSGFAQRMIGAVTGQVVQGVPVWLLPDSPGYHVDGWSQGTEERCVFTFATTRSWINLCRKHDDFSLLGKQRLLDEAGGYCSNEDLRLLAELLRTRLLSLTQLEPYAVLLEEFQGFAELIVIYADLDGYLTSSP